KRLTGLANSTSMRRIEPSASSIQVNALPVANPCSPNTRYLSQSVGVVPMMRSAVTGDRQALSRIKENDNQAAFKSHLPCSGSETNKYLCPPDLSASRKNLCAVD